MVAKFNCTHIYKHPWEIVIQTHLTKYPTEKEKNVLGSELVDRRRESSSIVYLKMVVTCLNVIPSVFRKIKILDVPNVQYEEECWIDRSKRIMKITSRPLGFTSCSAMRESSTFRPVPENPDWTLFEQEGTVEILGLGRAGWLIEIFARNFLQRGMKQNITLMEELINERRKASTIYLRQPSLPKLFS